MRIAFDANMLGSSKKTGIGNYEYNLVKAILNQNPDDSYLFLSINSLKICNGIKSLHPLIGSSEIKTYWIPSFFLRTVFELWQLLKISPIEIFTGDIDIFHSFDWYCPSAKKAKIVATVFDVSPLTHPEGHTKANIRLHTRRLKAVKKRADYITTISQASKDAIVRELNIDKNKITIAYPGVDQSRFYPIKDKNKILNTLNKYNLKPGYVLFVSSWYPRKNIPRLIRAFNLFKKKTGFQNKLVLVGKKSNRVGKLDINKNIICTDYVLNEELLHLYNGAKVFIYPSLEEGFGIPIIEAMACGCPVITSNLSSMPEVVGNAGLLINPFEVKDIVKKLTYITKNKRLCDKLQKAGFKRVIKFTWDNCAYQTLEVYKKALK
jgi:glycosyltransferase involved in cell wall biosynthesis